MKGISNSGVPGVNINGERWFPSERSFGESISDYWGEWYCDSECGVLRDVLMKRPGQEIDEVRDPGAVRFKEAVDPHKVRAEHDALADLYRKNGVNVHYVEGVRLDRPNSMFM